MRYAVIAMFSASATLAMASIGIAQNGQDGIHAPGAKTPSAIIAQGHQDVAHAPRAKTHATTRNAGTTEIEPEDTDRVITLDQQKAIDTVRASMRAAGGTAVLFAPTMARRFNFSRVGKLKDRSRLNIELH